MADQYGHLCSAGMDFSHGGIFLSVSGPLISASQSAPHRALGDGSRLWPAGRRMGATPMEPATDVLLSAHSFHPATPLTRAMFEKRSDLERFLTVIETRRIAAAADMLDITQPALTRVIARLERQFGGRLFERLPHGVRPTVLGVTVDGLARRILREMKAAEEALDAVRSGRTGSFRITASPTWGETVLPAALVRFHKECPGIEIRIDTAGRAEGVQLLAKGDSDLHCGGNDIGEILPISLRRERFVNMTSGIVACRDHPLLLRTVTDEDLARCPWIDFCREPALAGLLDRLHEATDIRAKIVVQTASACLSIMKDSPHLAVLPLSFLERLPGRFLQPLPVETGLCRYRSGYVVRRAAEELPPLRRLMQIVRETAIEHSE